MAKESSDILLSYMKHKGYAFKKRKRKKKKKTKVGLISKDRLHTEGVYPAIP